MFSKTMLKKVIYDTPRNSLCFVVVGGVALEIKGVVSSKGFGEKATPAKLWFIAGGVDHAVPKEIHASGNWLNHKHNRKAKA